MADEQVSEILAEWYALRESGDPPAPEEVIASHPEVAGDLRKNFAALGVLRQILRPGPPPGVPPEIGDFRILAEIGRGGMGVVYEAEQVSMKRKVALKVLSLGFAGAPHAVKRFQREAQAAGRLHHTNIVPIHAMGQHAGHWYYAMELVEGRPLNRVIEQLRAQSRPTEEGIAGGAPPSDPQLGTNTADRAYFFRVAEIFAGVAEALHVAHESGIVHRDIKPSNLLLDADGVLKVVDFGLAHMQEGGASMTVTGDLLGTPAYMSPEQALAKRMPVDHRTDVYSLGATLYELLTLFPPFAGSTIQEICSQIITKDPVLPHRRNRHVPKDLETIVCKAMEKDRDRRYASADELARDLRRFAQGVAVHARPIGPLARGWRRIRRHRVLSSLTAAVVVLALGGGWLGLMALGEASRVRQLRYDRLIAQCNEAVGVAEGDEAASWEPIRELLDAALELDDEKPEAYWLRALAPGRTFAQREADLDAASARRLPPRTYHLTRAHLLGHVGQWGESDEERARAAAYGDASAADACFEGMLLGVRGQRDEALRAVTRAVEASEPGSTVRYLALRHRARLRVLEGELERALEDFHMLRGVGDDGIDVRVKIAEVWRRMGRPQAESLFEELMEETRRASNEAAWCALLDACGRANARAWHVRASAAALESGPRTVRLLNQRAMALYLAGRGDEALPVVEEALSLEPDNHTSEELRAVALGCRGGRRDELAAIQEMLKKRPDCVRCLAAAAEAHIELGQSQEALALAEHALELDPTWWLAYEPLGMAWRGLGEFQKAREAFEQGLRIYPLDHELWNNLAALLHNHLKDFEEARKAVERSLLLRDDVAPAHENHGLILLELKETEAARAAFGQAVALDPLRVQSHMKLWGLLPTDERRSRQVAAAATQGDSAEAWHLRGHALEALDRIPEAADAYAEALRLDPGSPEIHQDRARILIRLGRLRESVPLLKEAIRLDPREVAYHAELGAALQGLGEFQKAREAYEQGTLDCPLDPSLWFSLAALLQRDLKDLEGAREAIERSLDLRDDLAATHFNHGVILRKLGETEGARAAFERGVLLDPRHVPSHRNIWDLLPPEERRSRQEAAAATPLDSAEACHLSGHALEGLDRIPEAADAYAEALRLDPGSPELWEDRARTLIDLGQRRDAIPILVEATKLHSREWLLWLRLGVLLHDLGEKEKAIEAYTRCLELRPDPGAYCNRSTLHLEMGRPEEALKDAAEVVRLAPEEPRFRIRKAECLAVLGRHEEAVAELARARDLRPGDADALNEPGHALRKLGRYEDARRYFRALTEVLPGSSEAFSNLGLVLRELGRPDEAVTSFHEAAGRDPRNPCPRSCAIEVLMGQRKLAEALRRSEEGADAFPGDPAFLRTQVTCLRALGREADARERAKRFLSESRPPSHGLARLQLAYLEAVAGVEREAKGTLEQRPPEEPSEMVFLVMVHAALGETDEAIAVLERMVEEGWRLPPGAQPDPEFDRLGRHARYAALLRNAQRG